MNEQSMSAEEAVRLLKEGNSRFESGNMTLPDRRAERRLFTYETGQNPFATVLACSDSRVPVEIIFDRGIGDIFVVRVAGNTCGASETASIEYAVEHLKTPVVVVLGHSQCGAVNAAVQAAGSAGESGHFEDNIGPAVDRVGADNAKSSGSHLVEAVAVANVWYQMDRLLQNSPIVKQAVDHGTVTLLGAFYEMRAGSVRWLDRSSSSNI